MRSCLGPRPARCLIDSPPVQPGSSVLPRGALLQAGAARGPAAAWAPADTCVCTGHTGLRMWAATEAAIPLPGPPGASSGRASGCPARRRAQHWLGLLPEPEKAGLLGRQRPRLVQVLVAALPAGGRAAAARPDTPQPTAHTPGPGGRQARPAGPAGSCLRWRSCQTTFTGTLGSGLRAIKGIPLGREEAVNQSRKPEPGLVACPGQAARARLTHAPQQDERPLTSLWPPALPPASRALHPGPVVGPAVAAPAPGGLEQA